MQNLIQFLFRHGVFFLFLLLEVICLYLVVRSNAKQQEIFLTSSNRITGKLYEKTDEFIEYWQLKESVDSLARENARLRKLLYAAKSGQKIDAEGSFDSVFLEQYSIVPARVINNSISSIKNYITLDKGADHGIIPGMGVIDEHGIVGIISDASRSFARVISILHSDAMISASIKRNRYFGSLVWKGFNPRMMVLEAIPKHAEIFVGDTVETSGFSRIFPKGLMIGTVERFRIDKGSNFYTVDVRLINDLSNVQQVYVISNALKEEQAQLEEGTSNE